jgi:hypothetical protein
MAFLLSFLGTNICDIYVDHKWPIKVEQMSEINIICLWPIRLHKGPVYLFAIVLKKNKKNYEIN